MTAATTPRLGLISPTNGDDFLPEDFVDTFTKLDGRPGIMPVANYAALMALGSSLTTAQDNCTFLQVDNGCVWQWVKPGSSAGAFRKITPFGLVKYAVMTASVSTSATAAASSPALINTSFVAPGGRTILAMFTHSMVYNSAQYSSSVLSMYLGSSLIEQSYLQGGAANQAVSHRLFQPLTAAVAGTTYNIKVVLSAGYGGGTSTANASGALTLWEI